jgi:hypothetical protein
MGRHIMAKDTDDSDLEREIIRTISYFDVFTYPLTKAQLASFLACAIAADSQFDKVLHRLMQKELVHFSQGYFYLSTRTAEIVASRLENERRAYTMLKRARWVSFFLKQVPFVRAVFLTGSLSKHVMPHKGDIDFMIVTEFNRLWVCKMILTGFRRIFLLNSKKYFCINLMVTENAIHFPNHNYFNAVEIATTQVIWNTAAFVKYQKENDWIYNYLPNWKPLKDGICLLSNSRSPLQMLYESVLNVLNLDVMNTSLMHIARKFWRKKHKTLDEGKFNSVIQCKPDISSVWHDDHQSHILDEFHQRLTVYEMEEAQ